MKKIAEILLLLLIVLAAIALRYVNPYFLADLPIVPDSAQYATSGYNLAEGKGFCIFINDLKLPPQYPPGFPLMLAPFYRLTGLELHGAIYLILAFSLLSILLCYFLAREVFGRGAALLAALLLAVSPLYVGYSQVLISDMASNSFIILGLWLAWRAAGRERLSPLLWLFAGASCGFSASVHLLSGVTVIPLAAAAVLASGGRFRRLLPVLFLSAAGFIAGLSPFLLNNHISFGSVLSTGYDYWSRWGAGERNFALAYALRNTAVSEAGSRTGNIGYYLLHFLGLSWPTLFAPYFPAVLLLSFFGGASCLRGKKEAGRGDFVFTVMTASLTVVLMALLFFYSFQMSKFLLPIVPFVCILAARGISVLLRLCRGGDIRPRLLRIPVGLLLLVTAWGCVWPYSLAAREFVADCAKSGPGACGRSFLRDGFTARTANRSISFADLTAFARGGPGAYWARFQEGSSSGHAPTWWYEGLRALDAIAPSDAFLVSGIDGVYVTHYFVKDTDRRYLPISRDVEYIRQRDLPLPVAVESIDTIRGLLRQGKKVYLDGFTFGWWGRYRDLLARHFALVPVAPYYGGKLFIYELALRDDQSAE